MSNKIDFTQDDLEIRFSVSANFSISLGLYDGPITRKILADNINSQIADAGGIEQFLSKISIEDVGTDDGVSLTPLD